MAKTVYVTHVGFSRTNPGKALMELGGKVILKKEPENEFDTKAIVILCENEIAGYVAGSAKKVDIGAYTCISNQELFDLLDEETDEVEAVIEQEVRVPLNNRDTKGFILSVKIKEEAPTMSANTETTNMINFILAGSHTAFQGRMKMVEDFKAGNGRVYLKLSIENGGRVIAEYNGQKAGMVKDPSQELMEYADNGVEAVVLSQNGLLFNCQVVVDDTLKRIEEAKKNVTGLMRSIINQGWDTKENLVSKVKYMRENKVSETTICKLLESYCDYPDHIKGLIPETPKTLYQDSGTGIVKKSVAYLAIGRNLLFEGDRGVGKNVLTETLAWLTNRPLCEFSLNSGHDNSALLGGKTFVEAGDDTPEEKLSFSKALLSIFSKSTGLFKKDKVAEEDAKTFSSVFTKLMTYFTGKKLVFEKSTIIEAFEYGGIIVFDEFNTSLGHVMSVFNSLLDDRRRITVPGYKTITAHKNFIAIATQNKDYQSTFENNEATIDRFVPIVFPTLDSIEDILFAKVQGVSPDVVKICQNVFEGMKNAVNSGEINERCLTIRGFIDACLVIKEDIPLKDALLDNISNRAQDIEDRKCIKNMIDVQVV